MPAIKRPTPDQLIDILRQNEQAGDILCGHAADEIARLRLTDAEREAARFCTTAALPETEKLGGVAGQLCRMHAATLRGLLERTK